MEPLDRNTLYQMGTEIEQAISEISELLLLNEDQGLENPVQQNKEFLTIQHALRQNRSNFVIETRIQERINEQNLCQEISEEEFQKSKNLKRLKVDLGNNHVNKINKSISVPNSPNINITFIN